MNVCERERGRVYECVCERERGSVYECVCVYLRGRPSLSFILSNKYSHGCLTCCTPGLLLTRGARGGGRIGLLSALGM